VRVRWTMKVVSWSRRACCVYGGIWRLPLQVVVGGVPLVKLGGLGCPGLRNMALARAQVGRCNSDRYSAAIT
jgi:hypothetical protein